MRSRSALRNLLPDCSRRWLPCMAYACWLLAGTLLSTAAVETGPSPVKPTPSQQDPQASHDWRKPSLVTIPQAALTLSEASDLLSQHGNLAITEWGSERSQPLVYDQQPNPLSWWAAVSLISEHFGLHATPAGSGWQVTAPAAEDSNQQSSSRATSRARSAGTAAEEPALSLRFPVQVFCEPLAFTEPHALSPPPTVIAHQVGPWRIEIFVRDRVYRRSLQGSSRWLELDFRVLGEPRLSTLGELTGSLELTAATLSTDPQATRSLRDTTPLTSPVNDPESHSFMVVGGRHRSRRAAEAQPMAVIADLDADDSGLTIHGQLHLTQLRPWNQQIPLTPNRWQSLTLGQHAMKLLLLTDLNEQATLSAEHAVSIRLLRRPGLIIAEASKGSVDPSLWQQLSARLDEQPLMPPRPHHALHQATGEAAGEHHQAIWLPLPGLGGIVHADPEQQWNIHLSAAVSSDQVSIPFSLHLPLIDESETAAPHSTTQPASDTQGGEQP